MKTASEIPPLLIPFSNQHLLSLHYLLLSFMIPLVVSQKSVYEKGEGPIFRVKFNLKKFKL